MFQVPGSSAGELHFRVGRVPVRVHPFFWVISVLMGLSQDTKAVLIWVAIVFVSILVHELGHVAAFRRFGIPSEVVLYGFGGLTVPQRISRMSHFQNIVISAAGPAAGFALTALILAGVILAGGEVFLGMYLWVIPSVGALAGSDYYTNFALNNLLFVNLYWGLVNLLPVMPLDGGHIAQAALTRQNPRSGARTAAILSAVAGAAVAGLALYSGQSYLFFLFGFLAVGSIQQLEKSRRWG